MANIKLIATDLDGTFMVDFKTPHPQNVRILEKCKRHGIAFCICTGRNWRGIRDLVAAVPFDQFCVINNGAAIYDTKTHTLRYRNRFAPETAREIMDILSVYKNAHVGVSTTDSTHVVESRMEEGARRRWLARAKENPEWAGGFFMHDSVDELMEACKDDIQRITIGIDLIAPGKLEEVYKKLANIVDVEITSGMAGHMEISAKDGTKAEALSVLADIYGAKPENVLALGDNYNDMHMLLWAGTGVAMGNADDRLKGVADYVTDTNVNAGVAKAIERIVFHNDD